MKIALINPQDRSQSDLLLCPLALGYLGAFLDREGQPCDLYNFEREPGTAERIVERHSLDRYDVLGFATYTHIMPDCLALVRAVKRVRPDCTIIMGGYHATPMARETLEDFAEVDFVIQGEGERPLLSLVRALQGAVGLADVPNLVWRRHGAIAVNPSLPPETGLDALPFPRRDFENSGTTFPAFYDPQAGREKVVLHVVSSRGCPYQCNYCAIPVSDSRKMRYRSAENVLREIRLWMGRVEIGHIFFSEPNFLVNHARSLELAEAIHAEWPELTFSFETRANQIVQFSHVIERLGRLGCSVINIGVESGSATVLKRLNKGTSVRQNEEAVKLLPKVGIRALPYMIMFDPDSTLDDLWANIQFLKRTGYYNSLPHYSTLYSRLEPLPGVPYREYYLREFGLPDRHGLAPVVFREPVIDRLYRTIKNYRDAYDRRVVGQLSATDRLRTLRARQGLDLVGPLATRVQILLLGVTSLAYLPYHFFEAVVGLFRTDPGLPELTPHEVDRRAPAARVTELEAILSRNDAILAELGARLSRAEAGRFLRDGELSPPLEVRAGGTELSSF